MESQKLTQSQLDELEASEIYQTLVTRSNDAQYILDLKSQHFLKVNPAFEELTGYSRDEIETDGFTADRIVAEESKRVYEKKVETGIRMRTDRYDIRLMTKSGEKKPVEVSVTRMALSGRAVAIGTIRDLTARKRLEQEMWEKIEELGRANNRIYALTEKIRPVPELVQALLNIADEDQLLEEAAKRLSARDGLAYQEVTFYLKRSGHLEPVYTTSKEGKKKQQLDSADRIGRIFRGEEPPILIPEEAVLPLKGRGRNLGVLEVKMHPKELEVLQGNPQALKGYTHLLQTVAHTLGLLVENLRLYWRVEKQATVDALTGLNNRRTFDDRLRGEFQRALRYKRELSLLVIDLDRFKIVNDTFGHQQGDQVLVEVALLLEAYTRDVDLVCRYGGDEFVILLPETPYEGACAKAETLCQEVASKEFLNVQGDGREVRVTFSVGVTSVGRGGKTAEGFLKEADTAMYNAKRNGGNRVA